VVDRGSLTHAKSRARKRNAPGEGGAESDPEKSQQAKEATRSRRKWGMKSQLAFGTATDEVCVLAYPGTQ